MPKVLQNENKIKEVLDHQLKTKNKQHGPQNSFLQMEGLTSSFNFNDEERNLKTNKMWRTGQFPMEVNAMLGLVSDES